MWVKLARGIVVARVRYECHRLEGARMTNKQTNIMVAAVTALGLAYGEALSLRFKFPVHPLPLFQLQMLASCAVCIIGPMFVWALYRERPDSPFAHVKVFADRHRLMARLYAAAVPLICVSVFIATFAAIKSGIPAITRYTWDPLLADADEALFGGRAAWEVLQPWLGHPWVSWVLDGAYHVWIIAFYAAALWFALGLSALS